MKKTQMDKIQKALQTAQRKNDLLRQTQFEDRMAKEDLIMTVLEVMPKDQLAHVFTLKTSHLRRLLSFEHVIDDTLDEPVPVNLAKKASY